MSNKLQEYVNFKPSYTNKKGEVVYYETSFYCKENMTIHPNLKSAVYCPNCFTDKDRLDFKAIRP